MTLEGSVERSNQFVSLLLQISFRSTKTGGVVLDCKPNGGSAYRVTSFVAAASEDKMLHGFDLLVLSFKDNDLVR